MRRITASLWGNGLLWLGVGLALAGPARAQAAAGSGPSRHWYSTSGVSVIRGDYGTADTTTVTQLSQTVKVRGPSGEAGLTVPYLFRHGSGVTAGESGRARNDAIPSSADGIGDLQLKGKWFWLEETESRPSVDLGARFKIPTASRDDGLGTGGVDFGFGPDLFKRIGSWMFFGGLEGILRDTPSGSSLHSTRLDYSVGTGYFLTERWTVAVSLDGGTPTNSGTDAPLEAVLSSNYQVTDSTEIGGFLLAGLTDGSPDVGAGVSLKHRF